MSKLAIRAVGTLCLVLVGCHPAIASARRISDGDFWARSYFPRSAFDGRCPIKFAAKAGESLTSYLARSGAHAMFADLDCVTRAKPDSLPLRNQAASYYYYQAYLVLLARGGDIDRDQIDELLTITGIDDAPLTGSLLYVSGALFVAKNMESCGRDLAQLAWRNGVSEGMTLGQSAQNTIAVRSKPFECTWPSATRLAARALDNLTKKGE